MGSRLCRGQVLIAFFVLSLMTGCLSLGGKTTYVTEGSDNANRISALETRVGMLEQAVLNSGPPAAVTHGNSTLPTPESL